MLRATAALSLGLVMLMPTVAAASPVSAASEQRAGTATTTSRDVSLGHRPVVVPSRARVRLTFEGREGQLVQLDRWGKAETCGARVLKTAGGKVVKPWAPGYWRLSRAGTYRVVSKPCTRLPQQTMRFQLRRVVQYDAVVPGVPTEVGRRSDVTHLVPVRLRSAQRLAIAASDPVQEVVDPDRKVSIPDAAKPLLLERPGRHWLAVRPASTVRTALTVRHDAAVDGQRIPVPAMGTGDTTHEVAFTARAGQWVYAELLDAAGDVAADTTRDIRVFGADGREVQDALLHDCSQMNANDGCTVRGPWLVGATGDHTMTISADRPATEQDTTLRVRAAVVAPDLTINGPAVTYSATSPGQWVVGRYPETPFVVQPDGIGSGAYLGAGNISASLGAWYVTAAAGLPFFSLNCWDKACDYFVDHLNPERLQIETPFSGYPRAESWALMVVPPKAQGSMDLTLTKPPQ